jgi:hypothetical protein
VPDQHLLLSFNRRTPAEENQASDKFAFWKINMTTYSRETNGIDVVKEFKAEAEGKTSEQD